MTVRDGRLQLTELKPQPLLVDVAAAIGAGTASAAEAVWRLARRIDRELGTKGALQVRGDSEVIADGIAGLIRLAPGVVLEIVPKYLDASWELWREDFFAIASLSRYGQILPREEISARVDTSSNLADLLGHALMRMYELNLRRPLRQYRTRSWTSFTVDGDLDPESVVLMEPGGFVQSKIVLDRDNAYTQTIGDAFAVLARDVKSNQLRNRLAATHSAVAPRHRVSDTAVRHRLPSRHRRWQTMYDLSRHITRGYGAAFVSEGALPSPGFVLRTDNMWEDLLGHALRAGLSDLDVRRAPHYPLGHRGNEALLAHPDYSIVGIKDVLLDAKNRSRFSTEVRIARDDLYESLAFLQAASANSMILLYPRPGDLPVLPVGEVDLADEITVGDYTVTALSVELRSISDGNGWADFCRRLGSGVRRRLPQSNPSWTTSVEHARGVAS